MAVRITHLVSVSQGAEGFDAIDSTGPYTTQQDQFIKLVRLQDVFEVRNFIRSNANFDVNENNVGCAALRLAISYNDLEMIDFLQNETYLKVRSSLFTAVREGSKDCVEKLMRPPSRPEGTPQDEAYIGPQDVITNSYMSPLIYAVHLEKHEIVELFVSAGYRVKEPCEDANCGRELSILRRINAYKALANPIYLAYTYIYYDSNKDDKRDLHPIYQIFELNGKLEGMTKEYYEFKVTKTNKQKQTNKQTKKIEGRNPGRKKGSKQARKERRHPTIMYRDI